MASLRAPGIIATVTAEDPPNTQPGWLLDELGHAGRENLDRAHIGRYDAKEDAGAEDEVELLRREGLTPESVVLEFGPGTGQFTVAVAKACARVIAVDVSEPMLSRLQAKVEELGLENVEIVHAGFLTYQHAAAPVDFIYSRLGLHHLPDFWKAVALSRLRRVVRTGGLLRLCDVVYSFDPPEAAARIEAWCATGGVAPESEWSRAELEEHVRDEHSTFTWLLEPMIERSGFEIVDIDYTPDGVFAAYVLRAKRSAAPHPQTSSRPPTAPMPNRAEPPP
jgi:ubiquinone/menaquinone biosynthesis C-methylase UbiE